MRLDFLRHHGVEDVVPVVGFDGADAFFGDSGAKSIYVTEVRCKINIGILLESFADGYAPPGSVGIAGLAVIMKLLDFQTAQ